jgi:arylsulfatase A-like enzyme
LTFLPRLAGRSYSVSQNNVLRLFRLTRARASELSQQTPPRTWLTRYSTANLPRYFAYLAGSWYLVSLVMLFLLKSDYLSDRGLAALFMWLGLVALPMMEALLAGLLVSGTKTMLLGSRPWRYVGLLLLVVTGTLLTVSLFWFLVSWAAASQLGFVTYGSIRSSFTDLSSILLVLTFRERALLAGAFCSSLVITLLMIAAAPVVPKPKLLRWSEVFVLVVAAVAGCFRGSRMILSHADTRRLERVFEAHASPSATLFWAPLLFPRTSRHAALTLPLSRRYGLGTYAERVDRNAPRPNILVFVIEALRAEEINRVIDGRPVIPTINKLAADGLNFTRAYAPSNESAYSVTSVVSGLHALKYSTRDTFRRFDYPLNLLRIYDLLSPAYRTAFVSSANENWQNMANISHSRRLNFFFDAATSKDKQDLLPSDPADTGQYSALQSGRLKTGNVDDATTTEQMLNWLTQTITPDHKQPFFALVSYQASHFPYEQGFHIPALFKPDELSVQERARLSFFSYPQTVSKRMLNRYRNSLAYSDDQIARILQFLKEHGQLENTIVCILGDHGELFYENGHVTHAGRLYNKTIQVAFVIWGAKGVRGEYSAPVSLVDLGPIIVDMVNMPPYEGFQGSVPSGLANAAARPISNHVPVFSTVQNMLFEDSVIVGRWKFLEQEDGDYQYLYDLDADPMEKVDRLSENPEVSRCLAATLDEFRSNQLAYYSSRALKTQYFPPRYSLARDPACSEAVLGN